MPVFADQSRESMRRAYFDAWRRSRAGAVLTPLEAQIARVIEEHPEYHAWLERGEAFFDACNERGTFHLKVLFGGSANSLNILHLRFNICAHYGSVRPSPAPKA